MSLAGMDLGPKMDWMLDNGLYQRFKVLKERCIDILSGPLHAMPEENQVYYLRYWMGEEGSKLISQWTAEGKITDDDEEATSKKKLRTYWQLFEDYTKPRSNSLIAVVELKRLFQGSMTLEQFVTKATLLVVEARYPARQKDRMVCDTLIAGISNDVVLEKIIKKGLSVILAQVLVISTLELHKSLSDMSNTKPSVNYVRCNMKKKNKDGKPSQQQSLGKFHGSGSLPSNKKQDANGKIQTKGKICYRCGKGRQQPDQKCGAIDSIGNKCGKKAHFAVICQKGKGFSHSSRSTSQTEPDYYTECGQLIYVQSHMLQTMSTKSQNIPEKSKLFLEFPIRLHYKDLNQKVLLKVDTGSNINCISLRTFHKLFPNKQLNRSMLLLENYGNSPVTIIGKVMAFIRWKGKVFYQECHVTNANSSPNLLSRDACFRKEVLQNCFAVPGKELPQPEPVINKTTSVSQIEETSQSTKSRKKMEECIPLIQCSIDQGSVSKSPLTKQKILDVYADVFKGLGISQENHTNSN